MSKPKKIPLKFGKAVKVNFAWKDDSKTEAIMVPHPEGRFTLADCNAGGIDPYKIKPNDGSK